MESEEAEEKKEHFLEVGDVEDSFAVDGMNKKDEGAKKGGGRGKKAAKEGINEEGIS